MDCWCVRGANIRRLFAILVLLISLLFGFARASQLKYSVEPVPEYSKLFYRESGWTGADGAYSVALANEVTLWKSVV